MSETVFAAHTVQDVAVPEVATRESMQQAVEACIEAIDTAAPVRDGEYYVGCNYYNTPGADNYLDSTCDS